MKIIAIIILLCNTAYASNLISLDLKETRLQEALHTIADLIPLNIAVSANIHGVTDLHVKNIPPRAAWDLLLLQNKLSTNMIDGVTYIMPHSEMIEHEKDVVKLESSAEISAPLITRIWQIHYAKAESVQQAIQSNSHNWLSPRGHLSIDTRTNSLCIQDTEQRLSAIQTLIRHLDIPVQQILIQVYLASIDSDFERELGIRFEQLSSTPTNNPHYGLALFKLGDGRMLDVQLAAMENQGHGELLSSPSLFTANQQTASIEAGEEIPYQEISRSGATGIAFRKAVLSLKVTPQIMPQNNILLQLQINQDKPSNRMVLGVPAIITRQMSTNILIKNNQTVVLGGIYESTKENQSQGIPFLSHIPLIGELFKQNHETHNKRELLVFVTPKLI